MLQQLEELKLNALQELEGINNIKELESWRVHYLGKKGELTNVLSGDVSARLDARGVKTQISVPKVVRYSKAGVPKEGQQSILCIKFASSDGKFWLKLAAVKEG